MRIQRWAVLVTAVLTACTVAACTVPGEPGRVPPKPDLSPRAVPAEAFPYGPAARVPSNQVPGVLADITMRPLRGRADPAECTPTGLDANDAVVLVGPGGPAAGTLTALIAYTDQTLPQLAEETERCPEFLAGSTGTTMVRTGIDEGPSAGSYETQTLQRRRTLRPAGGETVTSIDEWIAQRGDVRVYLQNRYLATELSPAEQEATGALFRAAVSAAFAGQGT